MTQRYLVFFWPKYYPSGGFEDLIGRVDYLREAVALLRVAIGEQGNTYYGWQIVDTVDDVWAQGSCDETADPPELLNLEWSRCRATDGAKRPYEKPAITSRRSDPQIEALKAAYEDSKLRKR